MRALEDDLLISTLGKVKIEHTSRQLHRCFTSTSTTFLWALFPVTMAASYLNLQSFVNTSSHKHLAASWGGLHWERQIRASAHRGSMGTSRLR
jgi:UDP-glucuronate 4-epimerase